MGRFRYSGVNWENREWRTAAAITTLGNQIEQLDPNRYAVDGTVVSKRHDQVSPTSDHRPDHRGIVHAIDFGGVRNDLKDVSEQLRLSHDPRIRYVIHNGSMFSSYTRPGYDPFEWRPYNGASPHRSHVHLSVMHGELADSADPWQIIPKEETDMNQELKTGDSGPTVYKLQQGLNGWRRYFHVPAEALNLDSQFGAKTETLLIRYQNAAGLTPSGVCGGITYASLMEYVPDRIDNPAAPVEFTARIVPIP